MTRGGAPPVDLVSSDDLRDVLKDSSLGVAVRTVEAVPIDSAFFDQF